MPKKYKVFTSAKLIKLLERQGFYIDRSRGSHFVLRNEEFKATIVVPKHRGDLPQGTLAAIIERSKLDENLFKQ